MLLYWFMPAFANSSVGSSCGIVDEERTNVCDCSAKKSKYAWRTREAGHGPVYGAGPVVVMVVRARVRMLDGEETR